MTIQIFDLSIHELFNNRNVKFVCLKMLAMKSIGRNLLNGFQLNPINRDLLIVISSGLLIAIAIITLLVMIASQI